MYFFGLLCMLGLFSACSDDDKVEPIGTEFDGVYKGTLDVDLDGTKDVYKRQALCCIKYLKAFHTEKTETLLPVI